MAKAYKGGDYEREICKLLSRWWSDGERDDIYWRSSQSGGRATQRAKGGLTTYGSYGDIAAVDPIGEPLVKLFTIELKRGSSWGSVGDLLDRPESSAQNASEMALEQAISSHVEAGTPAWMLICRRDRRVSVVFMSHSISKVLSYYSPKSIFNPPAWTLNLVINTRDKRSQEVHAFGTTLSDFLDCVNPEAVIKTLKDV